MTPEQIYLVKKTFEKIQPISETVTGLFYVRLFETAPNLRRLFRSDMYVQGHKLFDMLRVVIANLNDLDALVPVIHRLAIRHITYGVKEEHYSIVGGALMWALERSLGLNFTAEVEAAWLEAYTVLANTMKEAAAKADADKTTLLGYYRRSPLTGLIPG